MWYFYAVDNGEEEDDDCLQDKLPGPCESELERWYFDQTLGKCNAFVYGGCEGNGNNFETETDCALACVGHVTQEPEDNGKPELCKLTDHLQPIGWLVMKLINID